MISTGPCAPDLPPERVLVVIFEHNGKAGSVVEGATVDFEDVARYPRRVDRLVVRAEPPAIVSPDAFDMRFASAVIAQITEEYKLAVPSCRKRQGGLRRLVLVQVFRGVEIDLLVRFGPVVVRILFDVVLHERLRGFPGCGGEGAVKGIDVALLLVVDHNV